MAKLACAVCVGRSDLSEDCALMLHECARASGVCCDTPEHLRLWVVLACCTWHSRQARPCVSSNKRAGSRCLGRCMHCNTFLLTLGRGRCMHCKPVPSHVGSCGCHCLCLLGSLCVLLAGLPGVCQGVQPSDTQLNTRNSLSKRKALGVLVWSRPHECGAHGWPSALHLTSFE